jgi:hypothetical protein
LTPSTSHRRWPSGGDLAVLITYDHRMTSAAAALGLNTAAAD